jgi:hypothetical protein
MKRPGSSKRLQINLAKVIWGEMGRAKIKELRQLIDLYRLSVSLGDVTLIENRWYVTHSGLLRLACRRRCAGIRTVLQRQLSEPNIKRWVFRATVHKHLGSSGFVGYGDADPSNVSPLVRGAEMRVAETRAVNRALRKAYGIGLCSVEELGWLTGSPKIYEDRGQQNKPHTSNGSNNGQPRLRDRLCLLIRQYNLDPNLVKAYAADFCGTQTLKDASREAVESFIAQLATAAKEDPAGLLCKLNSYAQPVEVKP